jgi:uncharacterized protein (UPF0371 family)
LTTSDISPSRQRSRQPKTCYVSLSQLYHNYMKGIKSGYAKFETFPIWSLPLKHPVNVAYEAATADIGDFNLIDPFQLEAYGTAAVNYNRDSAAQLALEKLKELRGCEVHMTHIPTQGDEAGLRRLGVNLTSDPNFSSKNLFM